MDDQRLGELLLEKGAISPSDLMNARNLQKQTGGSLQQLIIKLNYLKPSDLNSLIAEAEHMNAAEVDVENIDLEAMEKIPRRLIEKYCVLPLLSEDEDDSSSITLAMTDPNNYQAIEEIQFLTGLKVEGALAPREAILKAINYYYNKQEELKARIREKRGETPSLSSAQTTIVKLDQLFQNNNQKEIVRALVETLIEKDTISLKDLSGKLEDES